LYFAKFVCTLPTHSGGDSGLYVSLLMYTFKTLKVLSVSGCHSAITFGET